MIHELFHSLSYASLKLKIENNTLIGDYSDGLVISSKHPKDNDIRVRSFGEFDEALTQILTEKFIKEELQLPPVLSDIFSGKLYVKEIENFSDYLKIINRGEKIKALEGKENLSENEVFQIFLDAYFLGKILPLARLFEETFGKGNFRKIAESYGYKSSLKNYIKV